MLNLDFKKSGGLIPAIAQDYKTGDVLMLAYINEESWNETLKSGVATYWSRFQKQTLEKRRGVRQYTGHQRNPCRLR